MNTTWVIIVPIIATVISPLFAVLLQEILVRARQNPKAKALTQKTAQTGSAKRLLHLVFPSDVRTWLLPVNFVAFLFLYDELGKSTPVTRVDVLRLVLPVMVIFLILLIDMAWAVYMGLRRR